MTIAITPLPTPPSRADSANFSARGDAFLAALPLLQSEANAQNAENNALNANVNAQVAAALAAGLANAATNAAAAASNATTASAQNTAAGTSASAAATSAAAAAVARDLSIAAWSASTAPAEVLAARSQSLHVGAIVKAIVYDTSKDSDGGAWRQRCQDKSWYTEALGGSRWIGQEATIAAAWTDAGSTTGAVFQASATTGPLTIGKFYTATSATTATEVFRGVTRDFPAVAGIVVESSRVVIYDLSTGAMWMVFKGDTSVGGMALFIPPAGGVITSVTALQGDVLISTAKATYDYGGVIKFNFASDLAQYITNLAGYGVPNPDVKILGISKRNATAFWVATPMLTGYSFTATKIVSGVVNDVAITVLDNAPIDPATGLPVPTIYAFTAGGVSRIAHDGTVSSTATGAPITSGHIKDKYVVAFGSGYAASQLLAQVLPTGGGSALNSYWAGPIYVSTAFPAPLGVPARGAASATASFSGLSVYKENPTTPARGMVAHITNTYNSGWQVGDSRGAWLADTVAETILGSGELVTYGTFDTDVNNAGFAAMYPGWTPSNATLSVVGGALRMTFAANGAANVSAAISTVIGKTYGVSFSNITPASPVVYTSLNIGSAVGGANVLSPVVGQNAAGDYKFNFVAISTTTYITVTVGSAALAGNFVDVDNISVKLAEPDRSAKNNGLNIVGTLTKTAVASGASLVAYSGFSAANYLEQSYNSQLDFGTGDFSVMGWADISSTADQTIFDRGGSGSNRLALFIVSTFYYITCSATGVTTATTISPVLGRVYIGVIRLNGFLQLYINGVLVFSVANTANITSSSGPLRLGTSLTGASPMLGSLALWRISATAPSADQIAHIYRTELPLFQPGAQCTIAGTSTAVTALAYDDATDLLHVGTSWGRTGFRDLLRVDSEANTTGALTSLSAQGGTILTGGASAKLYVPAKYLRDELQRREVARKALGSIPVFMDYDAVTSQVAFVLPKGYTTKAVYSAGLLKRIGSTKDYTVNTDGFVETVTFAVAPGNTVQVSIMAVRT